MLKAILRTVGVVVLAGLAYLLLWPVPIDPQAWEAPENPGLHGVYAPNDRLAGLELVPVNGHAGPEGFAVHPDDGTLYTITNDAMLHRINPETLDVTTVAELGGHPLELEFAADGTLYYMDSEGGVMSWTEATGVVEVLNEVDGVEIKFAEDLDITDAGIIYATFATERWNGSNAGTTLRATVYELMEHGNTGGLFRFDPASGEAEMLWQGGTFMNGMALSEDQSYIVFAEMGAYRLWRHDIASGETTVLLDALPIMPDNVTLIGGDEFSVGLVAPRDAAVDGMAGMPFLRKVVMRLPESMQPAPVFVSAAMMVDGRSGEVTEFLHDPDNGFVLITGVTELDGYLWFSSFGMPAIGRMPWPDEG